MEKTVFSILFVMVALGFIAYKMINHYHSKIAKKVKKDNEEWVDRWRDAEVDHMERHRKVAQLNSKASIGSAGGSRSSVKSTGSSRSSTPYNHSDSYGYYGSSSSSSSCSSSDSGGGSSDGGGSSSCD